MMAGLFDADIKLDENWQLTAAASGEAPIASNTECLIQDIRLEAMSQEGELFYDQDWGWSLIDFIQVQEDDLIKLEIDQRIKTKLSRREEIDSETIVTQLTFEDDKISIKVAFEFINDSTQYNLNIALDRVNVEVVMI